MSGWTVRLADQAAQDVEEILDWTLDQFGPLQLESYTDVINDALEALSAGPQLVFRVDETACLIEILRILHDSMDLLRHLDT